MSDDATRWTRELFVAGWRRKSHTAWIDPGGHLWLGPFGAWKEMRRRQELAASARAERKE